MLASVPAESMPARLSGRIEAALASESAQRMATEPATEAGRRDLPARSRHAGSTGRGWRIFGLSGPASRLVAAAGALVIIGGGGYEIATHINTGTGATVASSSPGSSAAEQQLKVGAPVTYHQASGAKSLPTVATDTNFTPANLGGQAITALTAAEQRGAVAVPAATVPVHRSFNATKAPATPRASAANGTATLPSQNQLTGCVDTIAAGRAVLMVELAKFDGKAATIIMVASSTPVGSADVWAVGRGCSAGNTQVLDHTHVART